MLTKKKIQKIAMSCELCVLGHSFDVLVMEKGDGFLIQLQAMIPDNNTRKISLQKGGKYYVSSHAILEEVVGTIWKALQDFLIHEAREGFLYKRRRIYGSHFDINTLYAAAGWQEIKRE